MAIEVNCGGHAVLIAKQSATFPVESPDGKKVYFVRNKSFGR